MNDKLENKSTRAWERHRAALAASWANITVQAEKQRDIAMHLPSLNDLRTFLRIEVEVHAKSEIHMKSQNTAMDTV